MSNKLTKFVTAHHILLARSFVIILGCIAVWWGIDEFPVFWQESSTQRIANRVIAGDPFKAKILANQHSMLDRIEKSAYCRPAALRSAVIIQVRMVEESASVNVGKPRDQQLEALGNLIHSSLSCSPADPFLWLALYWVESTRNGTKADYLKYLRMSYQLGPNEGWIGAKRNRVTFAASDKLPFDIAEYATNEFVGLVEMGFYEQAAESFTGAAWRVREQLLLRLKIIDESHRRALANILHRKYPNVVVPGIEYQDPRNWH